MYQLVFVVFFKLSHYSAGLGMHMFAHTHTDTQKYIYKHPYILFHPACASDGKGFLCGFSGQGNSVVREIKTLAKTKRAEIFKLGEREAKNSCVC